ncbi:hypothetical protein HaLaN_25373 [Haematococcus lacustris]|uniref:Uncharacterized protein n=1 Tax=Haematococcus lacustris TaxID=44745 RepID=A0A6A0A4D9_HAELA|nr:hypothetical protein HaLaN_25373 [Haematococcus lacustris]
MLSLESTGKSKDVDLPNQTRKEALSDWERWALCRGVPDMLYGAFPPRSCDSWLTQLQESAKRLCSLCRADFVSPSLRGRSTCQPCHWQLGRARRAYTGYCMHATP